MPFDLSDPKNHICRNLIEQCLLSDTGSVSIADLMKNYKPLEMEKPTKRDFRNACGKIVKEINKLAGVLSLFRMPTLKFRFENDQLALVRGNRPFAHEAFKRITPAIESWPNS